MLDSKHVPACLAVSWCASFKCMCLLQIQFLHECNLDLMYLQVDVGSVCCARDARQPGTGPLALSRASLGRACLSICARLFRRVLLCLELSAARYGPLWLAQSNPGKSNIVSTVCLALQHGPFSLKCLPARGWIFYRGSHLFLPAALVRVLCLALLASMSYNNQLTAALDMGEGGGG